MVRIIMLIALVATLFASEAHASCEDMINAAGRGELENVKRIAKKDKLAINCNYRGLTPLQISIDPGKILIIKYLVESGTDINATDREGRTALHLAAQTQISGMSEVLKYLVSKGAALNVRDIRGMTPLASAQAAGISENIKYLSSIGASSCDGIYVGKIVEAPTKGGLFGGAGTERATVVGFSSSSGMATVKSVYDSNKIGEVPCWSLR